MSGREWIDWPKAIIDTAHGQIELAITDGKHIHVSAGSNGGRPVPCLKLRGGEFYTSVHLGRYETSGGGFLWSLSRGEDGKVSSTAVHITRSNSTRFNDAAPPTYRDQLVEEILHAVNAWFVKNKIVAVEAERADANNDLRTIEGEIAELDAKLTAARTKAAWLKSRLGAAERLLGAEALAQSRKERVS